jgi:hypothetical protein
VKINPADVVAIPTDYSNAKGRCCKYIVMSDCTEFESGQQFGALHRENPQEAFDDITLDEAVRQAGAEVGYQEAQEGFDRDAEGAWEDEEDASLDKEAYCEGYHQGFDKYVAENKPTAKPISEITRRKLSRAARRQKRDANGRYI